MILPRTEFLANRSPRSAGNIRLRIRHPHTILSEIKKWKDHFYGHITSTLNQAAAGMR
jgi:hypothetical protein